MTVLAQLQVDVSFELDTASVRQQVDVGIVPTPPAQVQIDVDMDSDAVCLAMPSCDLQTGIGGGGSTFVAPTTIPGATALPPRAYFWWRVDDEDPGTVNAGPAQVEASLDSCTRSWSHVVQASTGSTRTPPGVTVGPLGYETTNFGPPPGFQVPVKIQLVLEAQDRSAWSAWDLINRAEATSMNRSFDGEAHLMEMSGSGLLARVLDRRIEYRLDPDHGKRHGLIIREMLILAGVDEDLIDVDPQLGYVLHNPVSIDCEPAVGAAKDVLRPIGYVLTDTPQGTVDVRSLDLAETPDFVLTRFDVALSSFSVDSENDGPSCALVIGTKAEPPPNIPRLGIVTESTVTETFKVDYSLPLANSFQDASTGSITLTGTLPIIIPLHLFSRLIVKRTYDGGCLIRVETLDFGDYNPVKSRYRLAAAVDFTINGYETGFFFGSVPAKDDEQEMFQTKFPVFMLRAHTILDIEYDDDDVRQGSTERLRRFFNPPAALKTRSLPSDTWETQTYIASQKVRGPGHGVLFDVERFFEGPDTPDDSFPGSQARQAVGRDFRQKTTDYIGDDLNYQVAVENTDTGYAHPDGWRYLYSDGTESLRDTAIGRVELFTREENSAEATDATRTVIQTGRDGEGNILDPVIQTGVSGSVPAMEICSAEILSRDSNTPFEAEVCIARRDPAGDLVVDRTRTFEIISNYVETVEAGLAMGRRELSIATSPRITLQLASPNPLIHEGQTLWFHVPDLGYTATKVLVEDVRFELTAEGVVQVVKMRTDILAEFEGNP